MSVNCKTLELYLYNLPNHQQIIENQDSKLEEFFQEIKDLPKIKVSVPLYPIVVKVLLLNDCLKFYELGIV